MHDAGYRVVVTHSPGNKNAVGWLDGMVECGWGRVIKPSGVGTARFGLESPGLFTSTQDDLLADLMIESVKLNGVERRRLLMRLRRMNG